MSIEITSVKLTSIDIDIKDGKAKIEGKYDLISSKGKVIAKQSFNTYDSMKINFDNRLSKDIVSDIESAIELEVGIQEAVKSIKGGGE